MFFFPTNRTLVLARAAEILAAEGIHPEHAEGWAAAHEVFDKAHANVFTEINARLEAAGKSGVTALVFTPGSPGNDMLTEVIREALVEAGRIPTAPSPR